jgi:hypothetical protein
MSFQSPSIHRVTVIAADAVSDSNWTHSCLTLSFTQSSKLTGDETYPAKLDIFGDASMVGKFQKIADAINAAFAEPIAQTEAA